MPHIHVRPPFGAAARSKSAVLPICRTHEGLQTLAGFQDQCIQPLCHLSEGKLLMRRRIVVAGRKYFNNRKYLSIIDRAGLMTHIPVHHPYGVASRSKFAPGEFVNRSATSPES